MKISGAILRHAAGVLLCAFAIAHPAGVLEALEESELTVVIANLRSGDGQIRIALWDGPETFATDGTALAEAIQAARQGEVRFTFQGLPDEGLGFSNGAWIGFGAPFLEEAAVEITQTQRVIIVNLRYPGGAPDRTRDR